jgi:hypothetical protein
MIRLDYDIVSWSIFKCIAMLKIAGINQQTHHLTLSAVWSGLPDSSGLLFGPMSWRQFVRGLDVCHLYDKVPNNSYKISQQLAIISTSLMQCAAMPHM